MQLSKIRKNKKAAGSLDMLRVAVLTFVIAAITLSIALNVNNTVTQSIDRSGDNTSHLFSELCNEECVSTGDCNWTCTSASYNASVLATTGLAVFSSYWSVIAIVVILAVIIGLFAMFGGGAMAGGIKIG